MVDRTSAPDYKPPLPAPLRTGSAQVAQLVEHATENRSVGGSIPPLGTSKINVLTLISDFKKCACPHCVRINVVGQPSGRLSSRVNRRPLWWKAALPRTPEQANTN